MPIFTGLERILIFVKVWFLGYIRPIAGKLERFLAR